MKKKIIRINLFLITICFVFSNFGNISSVNAQKGNISGWLYQSDGSTAITNSVIYINVSTGSNPCNSQFVTGTWANADGSYTTPALEPGNYYLHIWNGSTNYIPEYWASGGSVRNCAEAEAITVTVGTTNSENNFQLEQGGNISGWLYQSDGSTQITNSDIYIRVLTGSNPCNSQQVTGIVANPDGSYSIPALEPGNYYLQTWNNSTNYIPEYWASGESVRNCAGAEAITVTAGTTNSGKNFQLDEGGAVSGTIMDTGGTPITGVEKIGVHALQGDDCQMLRPVRYGFVDSVTGMYTIPCLAPGDYILLTDMQGTLYINEFWASGSSVRNFEDAETVTVTAGTTNIGKDFYLEQGGNISGWLYQSDGSTPITNSDIYIFVLTGDPCNPDCPPSWTRANDDGSYILPGFASGNYFLQTWIGNTDYIQEYWASGESVRDCAEAEAVTVTAGTTNSGKNFQLDEEKMFPWILFLPAIISNAQK